MNLVNADILSQHVKTWKSMFMFHNTCICQTLLAPEISIMHIKLLIYKVLLPTIIEHLPVTNSHDRHKTWQTYLLEGFRTALQAQNKSHLVLTREQSSPAHVNEQTHMQLREQS